MRWTTRKRATRFLSVTPSGTITAIATQILTSVIWPFNSNDGILYALDTNGNLYTIDTNLPERRQTRERPERVEADTALGYDNLNNVLYVDSASCKGLLLA